MYAECFLLVDILSIDKELIRNIVTGHHPRLVREASDSSNVFNFTDGRLDVGNTVRGHESVVNIRVTCEGTCGTWILLIIVLQKCSFSQSNSRTVRTRLVAHHQSRHCKCSNILFSFESPNKQLHELFFFGDSDSIKHFSDVTLSCHLVFTKPHQDSMEVVCDMRSEIKTGVEAATFVNLTGIKHGSNGSSF